LTPLKFTYTENLSEAAYQKMDLGLEKYELERGIQINYQKFALLLQDEAGEIYGVLNAYTAYAEVYIDDFWIDESIRGRGYGRQMLQALEDKFRNSGYNNINLVTNAFQAPEFYKKCGFQVEFVRVNKTDPRLTKTFFIKYL